MKVLKTITVLVISLMVFAFTAKNNPEKTISEKVAEKENLSTLLTALETAGLVETLKGEGPFTVFAPTDSAFNSLPEGKLDELLKPENKDELAKILKYHVVSGRYAASDLQDGQMLETLEGTQIKISGMASQWDDEGREDTTSYGDEMRSDTTETQSTGIKVNKANVIEADLMASNGVIHMIDAVVMPSDIEAIGQVKEYEE